MTPPSSTSPRATTPLSILVITQFPENVDAVSALLQEAGHSVYSTWISDGHPLGDILSRTRCELIVLFTADGLVDLAELKHLRGRQQPRVPIILVGEQVDEASITEALTQGAQDLGSLTHATRLRRICEREIRTFRRDRALVLTVGSARKHQEALATFMAASADAIIHLRETEILDSNRAFHTLLGLADEDVVRQRSILDFLAPQSHTALLGALGACRRGQWSNHPLKLTATNARGRTLALEVELDSTEWQGTPAIRLRVPAHRADTEAEPALIAELKLEPTTGLLNRHSFLDTLATRLGEPVTAGVRCLLTLAPDDIERIGRTLGPLRIENFMTEFSTLVHAALLPHDLASRFTSNTLMLLIERGNATDTELWISNLLATLEAQTFRIAEHSFQATTSVGLANARTSGDASQLESLVTASVDALARAQQQGGRQIVTAGSDHPDAAPAAPTDLDVPPAPTAEELAWIERLRHATEHGRFRLIEQPIASLIDVERRRSDLLVRLVDEAEHDVLPSEFLSVAERYGFMPAIDHWVLEAALKHLRQRPDETVFVRISEASVRDVAFIPFASEAIKLSAVRADRLCLQIHQETAEACLSDAQALRQALTTIGCRFALDRFGASGDLDTLVAALRPDVIKIDGALVQGIVSQESLQSRIRAIVKIADAAKVDTVAERVEDASTMAILFQLGVKAIQGHFVRTPETVTLSA